MSGKTSAEAKAAELGIVNWFVSVGALLPMPISELFVELVHLPTWSLVELKKLKRRSLIKHRC